MEALVYVFYLRQVPQTPSVFRASKDLEGTEELWNIFFLKNTGKMYTDKPFAMEESRWGFHFMETPSPPKKIFCLWKIFKGSTVSTDIIFE